MDRQPAAARWSLLPRARRHQRLRGGGFPYRVRSAYARTAGPEPLQARQQGRQREERGRGGEGSAPAKALLKFSTPRDPAALTAFINLRVLNPEHKHWRRGVEAAVIYARASTAT
ncbi:hypothetical protein ACWGEU_32430 [Streptomyces goshikiensis]